MAKDLRFTVTLVNVPDVVKRNEIKQALENMVNNFVPVTCKQVRVSRFNPGNEARRGKMMQKLATDAITNAVSNNKKGGTRGK